MLYGKWVVVYQDKTWGTLKDFATNKTKAKKLAKKIRKEGHTNVVIRRAKFKDFFITG